MEGITRNTPIDMLDMNRLFPGAPDGWLSEQQAYAIAHEFIDNVDVLVDLHCRRHVPVGGLLLRRERRGIVARVPARAAVQAGDDLPGTTATYAEQRGVRCTVVEIGGGYHDQPLARGQRGSRRDEPAAPCWACSKVRSNGGARQVLMRDMKVMRPRQGGICVPRAALIAGTGAARQGRRWQTSSARTPSRCWRR